MRKFSSYQQRQQAQTKHLTDKILDSTGTILSPLSPNNSIPVWIILQISLFNCIASYLFHMAFLLTEMCL